MTYTIEFPNLKFDEQFVKKLELPLLFKQESLTTMTRVKDETGQGRTAEGGSLRAYSPGYAAYKQATTGSSQTNLTVTGELLRSMVIQQTGDDTSIKFQGSHAPSRRRGRVSEAQKAKHAARLERRLLKREARSGVTGAAEKLAKLEGGSAKPARAARRIGGAPKKAPTGTRQRTGGGGKSLSNAALAEALYSKGFTGWFAYGTKDIDRIEKAVLRRIDQNLKNLLTNP